MISTIKDYYRRITESLPQRVYFTNFFILFLSIFLIFSVILAAIAYIAMAEAKEVRAETVDNFNYWIEVTEKHPNSPDAFYEAGYYAAKLGNREIALTYLGKAIMLDSTFEKAIELEKKL